MKISVVVPARNAEKTIVRCLDSIAVQEFDKKDYEVLIAFDSCDDDSLKVVGKWIELHPDINVRCFSCKCGSPGGARNVCLDNARGDYVMFVDADDWIMDMFAMNILFDAISGHNAVRVMDHGVRGNMIKFSNRLTIWLHVFSRELIGNDRFTDKQLCEDYEFVNLIRKKTGYDEVIVNKPLYFYEYDDDRMKNRINKVMFESSARKARGLSPMYVSDGFVPEEAKKAFSKYRNI